MSTVIYPSPIFGPVHSRRLGISLGINLLPGDGKVCSFDCIYCECGLNAWHRPHTLFPTVEHVVERLEEKLLELSRQGIVPDVFTFAGNGEPTLHPHFPEVVSAVKSVRDRLCPKAKLSILSNATQIHRPEIRQALALFDNNIQKLDTVNIDYIRRVDCPQSSYDVKRQISNLALFNGNVIIQTMFMGGEVKGESVDNTGDGYVLPYLEALQRIRPRQVMIYTIDRETPVEGLLKAKPEQLDSIARRIRELGIEVSVSY